MTSPRPSARHWDSPPLYRDLPRGPKNSVPCCSSPRRNSPAKHTRGAGRRQGDLESTAQPAMRQRHHPLLRHWAHTRRCTTACTTSLHVMDSQGGEHTPSVSLPHDKHDPGPHHESARSCRAATATRPCRAASGAAGCRQKTPAAAGHSPGKTARRASCQWATCSSRRQRCRGRRTRRRLWRPAPWTAPPAIPTPKP